MNLAGARSGLECAGNTLLYITYIIVRRTSPRLEVELDCVASRHINRRLSQNIFLPSTTFNRARAFDCSRETVRWLMPISSATSC